MIAACGSLSVGIAGPGFAAETSPPARAAVVAVGAEAAATGRAQAELADTIGADPRFAVQPTSAIASRVGSPEPERVWRDDAKARQLLERALEAQSAAETDRAIASIGEALALSDVSPVGRVRLLLWQATMHLAKGQTEGANESIRRALALDPDLVPSTDEFPPFIADTVRLLKEVLTKHQVRLAGIQPGVRAFLDGREIGPRGLSAVPGPHTVEFMAPGFRTVAMDVTVTRDEVVTAPNLPIHLARAKSLATAIRSAASGDQVHFARLAQSLGVDALVLASVEDDGTHGLVWTAHAPAELARRSFGPGEFTKLGEWARGHLLDAAPRPPGALASWADWHVSAGPAMAVWDRRITADTGFSAEQEGVVASGARFGVQGTRGRMAADAELTILTFAFTKLPVTLDVPTGGTAPTATGRGGTLVRGRLHGGARISAGRIAVEPTLGAFVESYGVQPVSSGLDLPFFASYLFVGPELRVDADLPLGAAVLGGGVGVVPVGSYRESKQTTGTTAAPLAASARIRGVLPLGRRWQFGAAYEGEFRSVRFKGSSSVGGFDPVLRDGTLTEILHTLTLTARAGF